MANPNTDDLNSESRLPAEPVDRLLDPITRFLHIEAASGVVLLLLTVAALALANSPWSDGFLKFWKTTMAFSLGSFEFRHSLKHLINDGSMVIFFFTVGLEVKRELVSGELSDLRRAMLPVVAALGGMVVPAAIYLALQHGQPGERGWGIPVATDIAFVVGCMALLGPRVPHGLRVALLSLAIIDDIGAILIIAFGYASHLSWAWLGAALAGLGLVYGCARAGVRNLGVYVVLAIGVWFAVHESGIHATMAGVILGLMTPACRYLRPEHGRQLLAGARESLRAEAGGATSSLPRQVGQIRWAVRETVAPLDYLLTALHPWVAFIIMPLFAFANAGVAFRLSDLAAPVSLAVVAGLVLGKPLGFVFFSWVFVRLRLASLPAGVTWGAMAGAGCLAGIGFTMALFIAGLALQGELLDIAKIGVLVASLLSAIAGVILLLLTLPAPKTARTEMKNYLNTARFPSVSISRWP